MQKIKKTYRVDPEKNASLTDRWTDRLMGRGTGLILYDPLQQRWRFDHVLWKFKNKFFLNSLACL